MSSNKDASAAIEQARDAAQAGHTDRAVDLYRMALEAVPPNIVARTELARLLTKQRIWDDAVDQWVRITKLRPDRGEAWLNLGRIHLQRREFALAESALRKLLALDRGHAGGNRELERLESMRAMQRAAAELPAARHIAIAGVSYCGSTLMARILGSLPQVENVGESHWLTRRKEGGVAVDVDFPNDDYKKQVHCFSCGSSCEVFTREFRQELARDPSNWYQKIAARLGCKALVTADKNYSKLIAKDPLLRMDAVVLFKSPTQAWYSNYKKQASASATMNPARDLEKYLDTWTVSYERLLYEFEIEGDKVFLDFEAFCREPEAHFKRLCAILGVRYQESALREIAPGQHCFGGNSAVNRGLRNQPETFSIREVPPPELRADHLHRIEAHEGSHQTHARMLARYRADFGILDPEVRQGIDAVLASMAETQNVLESKRRAFEDAAKDAERNLRIRLRKLTGSKNARPSEVAFLEHVLETVDFERFHTLQRKYLSEASLKFHQGCVKYLNLDYWLNAKFRVAVELGLDDCRPKRILDLGTGPAHFPFICKTLGHEVVATDIDLSDTNGWGEPHIYDALIELLGVDRVTHRIEAFEPMPSFGSRIDLVTAFMVTFNVAGGDGVWGIDAWRFFLKDIAENILTETGQIYLKMNVTGRDATQRYVNDELYDFLRANDGRLDPETNVFFFGSVRLLRQL